jgi:hypothetical protein
MDMVRSMLSYSNLPLGLWMEALKMKRPNPLGLKCDTITSPRRLVTTFLTSNSTEFEYKLLQYQSTSSREPEIQGAVEDKLAQATGRTGCRHNPL